MAAKRLEVRSIKVGYGATEVLHDVGLYVDAGEVVAVLGPNGAGKTTLVNTISGLLGVRSGIINSDDVKLSGMPAHKIVQRGIVQVPEGRRIFTELSVDENLTVGGYVRKDRANLVAVRERIFDLFPVLADRRRQPAGTLSGGEQQMLAIGRALCAGPKLLMLDEPSMGLAPKIISDIYSSFSSILEGGTAILLIEQNVKKALQISNRAYVLDQGHVVMSRKSSDLEGSEELRQLYLGGHASRQT